MRKDEIDSETRAARVLIYGINYAPEPTGVGRYTGEIGTYLAAEGVRVDVVTAAPHYPGWVVPSSHGNRYAVERHLGVRVTRCPLLLKADMRGVWRLLAPFSFAVTSAPIAVWRILTTRPDAVLCVEPTLFCAPLAIIAGKMVGANTVLHVQDLEVDAAFAVGHLRSGLLQRIANTIEAVVLRGFDSLVTISDRMRERLIAKGARSRKVHLVRNWIDLEKITPLDAPSSYRRELGLADGSFVVLYAGNIGPKQALHIVLDAARQLAAQSDLTFVIAGDGPEKPKLLAQYGQLPNVRFLPVQPEERLCELLNLADVHVLPQDRGAVDLVLPSKLGGMLASGKPCIVMAEPGTELHEFLGDSAILLPPGDGHVLANAVEAVFHSRGREALSGVRRCIEALDARVNLPAFMAILLAGGPAPKPSPSENPTPLKI